MANKGLSRKRETFVEIFGKISEHVVNQAFRGVNVNETERSVGKRRTSKRDEFGGLTIYIYILYVTVAKAGKQERRWLKNADA